VQCYAFQIRIWGDTYGGVRELWLKLMYFSGGRPNRDSPLKFGAAYRLVIFFDCGFCKDFFEDIFTSIMNWILPITSTNSTKKNHLNIEGKKSSKQSKNKLC
jgi:hypothetical protein